MSFAYKQACNGQGREYGYRDEPDIDPLLLWSIVLLLAFGLVMVYSASGPVAITHGLPDTYFLARQSVFLCIGGVLALLVFTLSTDYWRLWAPLFFWLGLIPLILVLVPGVGVELNGAKRWINLGVVNIQPSEITKLLALLYAAAFCVRRRDVMDDTSRVFWPMVGATALVGGLLVLEPDFGAFVVICTITFGVLFLGGITIRPLLLSGVWLGGIFALLIWYSDYRRARLLAFLDPWKDQHDGGYQLTNSLIAFGNGEIFGAGLGASVGKEFLPEAYNDFLFAVIGEEFGFIGVLVVVCLFALMVHRAFAVGREAQQRERYFPALAAMGVAIWFGIQGLINMLVNVGLLPTKGLTLPLMSFGGSSLVTSCIAAAVLLRVDWENRQLARGKKL